MEAIGDVRILDMAAFKKDRFMAKIDGLEAEKYDPGQGGKSAFGIASRRQIGWQRKAVTKGRCRKYR